MKRSSPETSCALNSLAALILSTPPARRGAVLKAAISMRPSATLDETFAVGPIRAAFAVYWEQMCGQSLPIERLRALMELPLPINTVLAFGRLMLMKDIAEIDSALGQLIQHLQEQLRAIDGATETQRRNASKL